VDTDPGRQGEPEAEGATSERSRRALAELRVGGLASVPDPIDVVRRFMARGGVRLAVGSVTVVLIALVLAVVIVRRPSGNVDTDSAHVPAPTTGTTSTTTRGLIVDVGGAVRSPGVYRLAVGSRVVDALEAAGGPAEDIDLDRINLASPIDDGQRVWMARRGEGAPSSGSENGAGSTNPVPSSVDLNTATIEQLDALPGIGPATARAIIERRRQVGRFRSVEDLLTVKGIGSAKLDALRDSVVVR